MEFDFPWLRVKQYFPVGSAFPCLSRFDARVAISPPTEIFVVICVEKFAMTLVSFVAIVLL